ncbi:rsbT co-antagonist protein RsbR [Paucimonas lemoignei]|uniref:RsbT co-antagonist protein RsbR n=1 Tax=Paucimonas lemoignei TaxID=29443 RepID=A0A4R3HRG6_PAULE|nr:STAS domain-containing protein [Paucimonas lemoignei]TCS35186.1 rsbT co-antagonist protein RsbR [Paucimonas lemoignei]
MALLSFSKLSQLISANHDDLLKNWTEGILGGLGRRANISDEDIKRQAAQFLTFLAKACGESGDVNSPAFLEVRQLLTEISDARVRQGFTPIETANFVFSLKQPLFALLRKEFAADAATLAEETWAVSTLFDQLGLFTVEVFQKSREQIILRQQQELLELSTPVVQLWKDVLALPLIGTLDSARTQVVMESLLQKIIDTGASIAIIDITGVPTVDTLVAQHLLKTVAAARLMGADCIISGIRPQIAQTIVHLGVALDDVITKATLADAFMVALKRTGSTVTQAELTL